jgi:hypothetical protein
MDPVTGDDLRRRQSRSSDSPPHHRWVTGRGLNDDRGFRWRYAPSGLDTWLSRRRSEARGGSHESVLHLAVMWLSEAIGRRWSYFLMAIGCVATSLDDHNKAAYHQNVHVRWREFFPHFFFTRYRGQLRDQRRYVPAQRDLAPINGCASSWPALLWAQAASASQVRAISLPRFR